MSDQPPIRRPSPWQWLWYAYGGRLPAEYRTWVLHDVTCSTWLLRHFARWVLLVAAPLVVLILLLGPTSIGVRLIVAAAVGGGIVMFALVNSLIDTDRRAVRAGYSFNLPGQVRHTRAVDKQRQGLQQRRERSAARRARR